MWRCVFGAILGVVVFAAAPVQAADLPVKAVAKTKSVLFDWTGFYVGGHIGAARGESIFSPVTDFIFPGFIFTPPLTAVLTRSGTLPGVTATNTNVVGGGQLGFNVQRGAIVYGLEGDIGPTGLRQSVSFSASSPFAAGQTLTGTYSTAIDWMASLRARLGMTWDRLLAYATGGVAFVGGEVKSSFTLTNSVPGIIFPVPGSSGKTSAGDSFTKVGWTLGAGVEWAFGNAWTLAGEYRHFDFGRERVLLASTDPSGALALPTLATEVRLIVDQVTLRANYRFSVPRAAR
jgi:outer membrane immunogenic protein